MQTLDFYVSLLTHEYQNKPKIKAILTSLVQHYLDTAAVAASLVSEFDIRQAVGVQLDTLGIRLGQSRVMTFQPNYVVSPILQDDVYRILLLATIGRNQWDGQQTSLYTLWESLFPGAKIAIHDNHHMNMDVFLEFPDAKSIFIDLIEHGLIVPRPQGVRCNYWLGPPFPLFGCDFDDPFVSGCDKGWIWTDIERNLPQFGCDFDDGSISGCDRGWCVNVADPIRAKIGEFTSEATGEWTETGDGEWREEF